jgi:hypothetical protein
VASSRATALPPAPAGSDRPVILARVYPGYHQHAVELFQLDAEQLVEHGYVPISQSYAAGQHSAVAIVGGILLAPFVIGIAVLVYLALTRPPGNLAVTYMRRDSILAPR